MMERRCMPASLCVCGVNKQVQTHRAPCYRSLIQIQNISVWPRCEQCAVSQRVREERCCVYRHSRRAPGINSLYITLMTGQGSLTTHKSPAAGQQAPGVDAIDLGHDSTRASVLPHCLRSFLVVAHNTTEKHGT